MPVGDGRGSNGWVMVSCIAEAWGCQWLRVGHGLWWRYPWIKEVKVGLVMHREQGEDPETASQASGSA